MSKFSTEHWKSCVTPALGPDGAALAESSLYDSFAKDAVRDAWEPIEATPPLTNAVVDAEVPVALRGVSCDNYDVCATFDDAACP